MAIVQTSLAEEILSNQERAVLRKIYRAAQLAEGLKALNTISSVLSEAGPGVDVAKATDNQYRLSDNENTIVLRAYLSDACLSALGSIKVPAVQVKKVSPSTQTA